MLADHVPRARVADTDFGRFPEHYTVEHAWEQRNKTGTWRVPQTQEGYDTQWSVDYGMGEREGKGRLIPTAKEGRPCCNAVIGPDDAIRGLPRGAADDYPDCCGREVRKKGIFRVRLDDGSKLTCYRCDLHGGGSAGGYTGGECSHPGCSTQGQSDGNRSIENPINKDLPMLRYCKPTHKAADAPRVALLTAIRKKLGQNDPVVQTKLTALNDLHNKKDDNMPFDMALAQLNTILAAGTLQALQDALDAGPSGAGGA